MDRDFIKLVQDLTGECPPVIEIDMDKHSRRMGDAGYHWKHPVARVVVRDGDRNPVDVTVSVRVGCHPGHLTVSLDAYNRTRTVHASVSAMPWEREEEENAD